MTDHSPKRAPDHGALYWQACAPNDALAPALLAHPRHRVLHLLRHGESLHQVHAAQAAARGVRCRCDELHADQAALQACPYLDPALTDDDLTAEGIAQVSGSAHRLEVDLVLTACARRSLATARAAFQGLRMPPCLALEELRARTGQHMHSRRSRRSVLVAAFPQVDFSAVSSEEDLLWSPHTESREHLDSRLQDFLRFLSLRPERRVAIVTHFTVLLALTNGADDSTLLGDNPRRPNGDPPWLDLSSGNTELRTWLAPGQWRTLIAAPLGPGVRA